MTIHPPLILGIRHHSPACARLVAQRIRELRPKFVLIEGPADFNGRLGELLLPHQLPIAIYSYLSGQLEDEVVHHGCWSPFLQYSPEWQALTVGTAVGAQLRFIDLPAWHVAMREQSNRYADTPTLGNQYLQQLAERLGVEQHDALWDQLFEDEADAAVLQQNLATHFEHLRFADESDEYNQAREQKMAEWIAWAQSQLTHEDECVLVVCGGYHAPALAQLWPSMTPSATEPDTPFPLDDTVRYGSFLVPYTFKRLDAFTGYAAGMPSPAYYQWIWERGAARMVQHMMQQLTQHLRRKKLLVSTADLIAMYTRAQALARLRGHKQVLRFDWLDALGGALVKEALDVPLPWSYRGPLLAGTAPVLVAAMDVLAGNQAGKLAPSTPQPPLVSSFYQRLAQLGINLTATAIRLELDLFDDKQRQQSRVLHQALLLEIPGFERLFGPNLALSGNNKEGWRIAQPFEQLSALIEASAWGATLHDAARNRLEDLLLHKANDIRSLAELLNRAAFAGLMDVSEKLLNDLPAAIQQTHHFEAIGIALGVMFNLLRHGEILHITQAPVLQCAVVAAWDRALWLLEPAAHIPPAEQQNHQYSYINLRQIARELQAGYSLPISLPRLFALMQRKQADPQSAPVSRGAALGLLISLEQTHTPLPLLNSLAPNQLGDALSGLLALARDTLLHDASFTRGFDQHIQQLDNHDFVIALPALRQAFTWLPTRERGQLAEQVLKLHQADKHSRHDLLKHSSPLPPEQQAANQLLEKQAIAWLEKWGISV